MKLKRIGAALLAAALMTVFFAGCGAETGSDVSNQSNVSDQSGSTVKKEKLRVATNAEFLPWEGLSEDGDYIGFDMDLIRLIGEKIGMEVEISNMDFNGVVGSIPSGTCDVGIAGLTITPDREKNVAFSESYHETAQILIVRQNDNIFTGTTKEELDEQLKNKTVGVCEGFTGEQYANGADDLGYPGIEGADIKVYKNISLAIADLKNNVVDVVIMDDTVAKNAASTDENKNDVRVIDVPLTVEKYAIALKKGNTELKEKIDKALQEIKDSGKLDELKETWKIGE